MIVALGTPDGLPHPNSSDSTNPIGEVARLVILLLRPALLGGEQESVEARSHPGLHRGVRQQIAGQLFPCKLVEGLVVVERANDVIAVGPDVPRIVGMVADGVGEAHEIEPTIGHAFPVLRRGHQAIHPPLIGTGGGVGLEGVHPLWGRRQAGEIQAQPSGQRTAIGLWRGLEVQRLQTGSNQPIDTTLPLRARQNGRANDGLIGPMSLILGSLGDPPLEQCLLFRLERLVRLGRRHQFFDVITQETVHQFTPGSIARQDRFLA